MGEAAAAALISGLMAGWFTPSSIFIFLNLVIGTILITTRFAAPPKTQIHHDSPQLLRSPSLLHRLSSFNYYHHPQTQCTQPQLLSTPSLLQRVKSFNFALHDYKHQPTHPQTETESTQPESERPCPSPDNTREPQLTRAPSLLQRLNSIKASCLYGSDSMHGKKGPEPEPKMEGPESKTRKTGSEEEENEEEGEGVDAKADDFINRFKKQLRLQRVASILRHREMLRSEETDQHKQGVTSLGED